MGRSPHAPDVPPSGRAVEPTRARWHPGARPIAKDTGGAVSERSELTMSTERRSASDAIERGTSEERERATSTARTLCHIGAAVAKTQ